MLPRRPASKPKDKVTLKPPGRKPPGKDEKPKKEKPPAEDQIVKGGDVPNDHPT